MSSTEKPAEFFSDEHRDSHMKALIREGEGYDVAAAAAKAAGQDTAAAGYEHSRAQVDAELKRLGADAQPARKRAESR